MIAKQLIFLTAAGFMLAGVAFASNGQTTNSLLSLICGWVVGLFLQGMMK
jgi:hypothetical protein